MMTEDAPELREALERARRAHIPSGNQFDPAKIEKCPICCRLASALLISEAKRLDWAIEWLLHNAHIGGPGLGFPRAEDAFREQADHLRRLAASLGEEDG